ncbi:Uncharacterised protein [Stutzerimonas stutzeri]|uniref:hypothetical protein n=1 Tax=Stutzerimonas stutzeri subgroup TaxID=578833 RepID=UPI000F715935|nr:MULTISPECIES: hypothetical protein [Stutzerimonas stutzeri subgroup]MCQ2046827.1 hypothetical protein [Stutzerimonas kunmingensis]QQC11859.1 hypothetical protein I6I22_03335 [Stutzerimonas stutzeri]VEI37526.1 Uncharacterised protein [Stutzerimonas stutzeri]
MKSDLVFREVFHNNLIIVVNAIPEGQLQSAKRVAENIQDHLCATQLSGSCFYEQISTANQLRNIFSSLEYYCAEKGAYPVLHIEAHGLKGVGLDIFGEIVTWKELHSLSQKVNILAQNNFGLVLAGCYGNEITKLVEVGAPCPFRFVLGPSSEVKAGVIEDQTTRFYKDIISTGDLNSALSHVEEQFIYFMSSRFFLIEMSSFFARHAAGRHQRELRERMLTTILEGWPNNKFTRKAARYKIKEMLKNPEEFIMGSMETFLHGEKPVNYSEIKSFYMQIKL